MYTAEQYKAAIRTYMEAMGYAQTTDSIYEGDLPDMVFLPLTDASDAPLVWVEAKARELSVTDKGFREEMSQYLNRWLNLRPDAKFSLKVFIRHMRAPTKWEAIFGNGISDGTVLAWLSELDVSERSNHKDRTAEILSFFSETEVIEGTGPVLIDNAKEKASVGLSAMNVNLRARELVAKMKKRSKPIPRKSNLVSNLLEFHPPTSYAVLTVDDIGLTQIMESLKETLHPPYQSLSKGKLLTFYMEEAKEAFDQLNPVDMSRVDISYLETEYPKRVMGLLNGGIDRLIRILGARRHDSRYYFKARREVTKGVRRRIPTPSGRTLTVARPMWIQENSGESLGGSKRLNFVFHLAFEARCRRIWGKYFVEMRLRRLFTRDGLEVIEGDHADRIDRHYRNPIFSRAGTQQAKLSDIAWWVFPSDERRNFSDDWMGQFRFGEFLMVTTGWKPDAVDIDQQFLDDYGHGE